jgi:UDP-glucuronate 4-epimerase
MGALSFDSALVTGAAGFIGSHLAERLVDAGCRVRGIDCLTPYYDPRWKRRNLKTVSRSERFEFREVDLRTADLAAQIADVEVVFHQAAQPGVRASWSDGFALYDAHNILATQRLLEAARTADLRRFVYASSSSVYGEALAYPTSERDLPRPHSPYGVTKLAAEHLCGLFAANWGVPTVALRYFTVYGPRQRPDMAIHRLIQAALEGHPFPLYGSGDQVRDFTFVSDVVEANILAAETEVVAGSVVNIAGGSDIDVRGLIELVEGTTGFPIRIDHLPAQAGDVRRTGGSTELSRQLLGWFPKIDLAAGIRAQVEWHRQQAELLPAP